MSADEIRKMSPEDRRKLLQELRLELIKLRAQASMGTLDKPHKIKLTRKNIARILTVEREEMFRGEVGEERKR
ncbi:MAG: 50S ribosomal protein L29 [Desulfurococcales archaeon]|nr:50S ribosomal protein L29 [Desulfurococcales archaeon]NAZ14404.1 50S ribosomal protein L29 [Desulfurococcales archaeon]